MGEKLCRILTRVLFAIPLFLGFANFSNGQPISIMDLPQTHQSPSLGIPGGRQPQGGGCQGGQCGARQQPQPQRQQPQPQRQQQPQPQGDGVGSKTRRAVGVVLCYSQAGNSQRWFHGTHVAHEGNHYIVTCAHGLGAGWDVFCIVNNKAVPIKILGVAQLEDLAALSVPQELTAQMPLASTFAAVGETVTLAGRSGKVLGYRNSEIRVRGFVEDGDSGGPIYSRNGLLGVIASYEHDGTVMRTDGITSGPNVTRIAEFLSGLKSPPPSQPVSPPIAPKQPGTSISDAIQSDLVSALDRISKLEKIIKSLPVTECKEVELQVQRVTAEAEKNKNELERQGKRLASLEDNLKAAQVAILRTTGAIETSQKGMILQKQNVDVLIKRIRELEIANKRASLRIQRVEQSTTSLTTAVDKVQKGKLSFRLRVDQAGRVTEVEPR